MKILVLVQSFVPEGKYDECLPLVRDTLRSIRSQRLPAGCEVKVVLSDDGSPYIDASAGEELRILPPEDTRRIAREHALPVDDIVRAQVSDSFRKADLFNGYLRERGSEFDLVVFLDDDHALLDERCLERFVGHARRGYNFIVGRVCNPDRRFRSYHDRLVQGTTIAVSRSLLESIGGLSEHVRSWGCGFDPDLFWRLYQAWRKGEVRAIYDGNIVSVDRLSKRWQGHMQQAGGFKAMKEAFRAVHGVDPHDNPCRRKSTWIERAKDEKGIPEAWYPSILLPEYLSYAAHPLRWKARWGMRWASERFHSACSAAIDRLRPLKSRAGALLRRVGVLRAATVLVLAAVLAGCSSISVSLSPLTPVAVRKGKPFIISSSAKGEGWGVLSHPRAIKLSDERIILRYYVGGDKRGEYFDAGKRDLSGISPAVTTNGGLSWTFGEAQLDPVVSKASHYIGADIPLEQSVLLFAGGVGCEVDGQGTVVGEPWMVERPRELGKNYVPGYMRGVAHPNGNLYVCLVQKTGSNVTKVAKGQKAPRRYSYVVLLESTDRGRTWSVKSKVASPEDVPWGKEYPAGFEGPNEPSLVVLPNGELLCAMRVGVKIRTVWDPAKSSMNMLLARSTDAGATWERTWMRQAGAYPKLLLMSNGVLVLGFGRPGNNLVFSTNGGRTWGCETALTRADARTSGYRDMVEVAPGRLLVVFDAYNTDLSGLWLWEPKPVNALFGMYVDVM